MDIRSILLDHGFESAENASTNIDLTQINQDLSNLSTYIDTTFADGIISQTEANRIQSYINSLNTDNVKLQQQYTALYNNADLTDETVKTNLYNAMQTYNTDYVLLLSDINNAIASGVATKEATDQVDKDYTQLAADVTVLTAALENARNSILGQRSSATLDSANSYTDTVKTAINTTTDQLNKDLYNADGYISTTFRGGVLTDAQKTTIQSWLNTLSTDKAAMDNRYTQLDSNYWLTDPVAKPNLESAYNTYNTAYQNLVDAINNGLAAGSGSVTEDTDVTNAFANFETSVSNLSIYMEQALNSLSQARADNAEALAKKYAADNIGPLTDILDNMDNDSMITQSERSTVKGDIARIIGYVIGDVEQMPDIATIDQHAIGEAYAARIEALNAGIPETANEYIDIGNSYTALANYLNAMVPLPWDVTSTDTITVDKNIWRNTWLDYFSSVASVKASVAGTLNSSIDGIQVGSRNLLMNTGNINTANQIIPTYWSIVQGSAITGSIQAYDDSVYGGVVQAILTTNAISGDNGWVIQNSGLTMANGKFISGQIYTFSCLVQNDFLLNVNFMDSDGTNAVVSSARMIPKNTAWASFVWTFTATSTGNAPRLYISKGDDTLTGNVFLTYVKLEIGNRVTGWQPAPEDLINNLNGLQARISTVEQNTTNNSIVSTVTSSDSFTGALAGKANASDLSDYATSDALSQEVNDRNAAIASSIAGIDFSPFVTQSQLTQASNNINMGFVNSGGVNLLKNSVGYSGTDFWTVTNDTNGSVSTTQDPSLAPHGASSGLILNGSKLDQTITVMPGVAYTLSAYVKKGTAGTGYIQISETGQSPQIFNLVSGTAYNYQQVVVTITPATSTLTVELYGDVASGGVIFTNVIVNVGNNAFQWQQAPGEVYNANINFDANGIRVTQTDANGNATAVTVMTPDVFAGYADVNGDHIVDTTLGGPDEVFRMDQDTFVMKSATINPIKIMPIVGNGKNGIAFIGSN